jgi:hypothetical protein
LTKKKPPKRQKRVVYPAKRGSCDRWRRLQISLGEP